jgi:hypothetical protein
MREVKRLEYKYLISYKDYISIRNALRALMIHDVHNETDTYNVTSIYLDDIVYTGVSDKAFGNETHSKYRIRYYDDYSFKKLELKKKVGDASTKISTTINNEVFNAILTQDFDTLEEYFEDPLIRKYSLDMMLHNLEPKLNIGYLREAYKDEMDNVRITFDHTICGELFYEDVIFPERQVIEPGFLVLEVKYEHFLPQEIKKIINKINATQIAYSKYFMGYNSLGI